MNNSVVILLTACINPNGMSKTVLQDSIIRRKQYDDALSFYLTSTSLPVVFVENTGTDISNNYLSFIKSDRLEYLTFNGNDFDKNKGKGYGEAKIIEYAYHYSKWVSSSKYVIKITGRIIVKNINSIASSKWLYFPNIFRCDLLDYDFVRTVVIVSTPKVLYKLFCNRMEEISEDKSIIIENILYEELKESTIKIIPFLRTPHLEGIFATKNIPYENKPSMITFRDNLFYLGFIEKERKNYLMSIIIKSIYYLSFLFNNK